MASPRTTSSADPADPADPADLADPVDLGGAAVQEWLSLRPGDRGPGRRSVSGGPARRWLAGHHGALGRPRPVRRAAASPSAPDARPGGTGTGAFPVHDAASGGRPVRGRVTTRQRPPRPARP